MTGDDGVGVALCRIEVRQTALGRESGDVERVALVVNHRHRLVRHHRVRLGRRARS